ncbi:MAG: VanW family protein [Acidimicrobiia bacterium]|nr:VanW family protein [Acidimicrobiia bacterium]MDH3463993.1 VanW family protein [Acidimicrobiia bacterium]
MSLVLARYFSLRSPLLYIGLTIAVSLGASAYAWYDHLTAGGDSVAGNVAFVGDRLDGMTRDEVRALVIDRALDVLSREVTVGTPTGEVALQVNQVGFDYDIAATVDEALASRHQGGFVTQFQSWLATMTTTHQVRESITFDPEAARATLEALPQLLYTSPTEPGVAVDIHGVLGVRPGVAGSAANIDGLVAQLSSLDITSTTLGIEPETVSVPPQVGDDEAARLADDLNELTRGGVSLSAGGTVRQLNSRAIRQNLLAATVDGELVTSVNYPGLQTEIEALFPDPIGGSVPPTFEVDGENVSVLVPGFPSTVCCTPDTAAKIANAVLSEAKGPFLVNATPPNDPLLTEWFDGSHIVDQVSTFTTPHSCCENRVINIQRMADIVRGYYLLPGEIFSLNDFVGPRTTEKGFVPAGAIRSGRLTPEIGGGVSQFATTIFNAAYFAGLDFVEYQAHSLYFSRYPFGREATISSPAPDLVIKNTTAYPVLIWTSFTPTSITVSMYSTKNVEAEQVAVRSSKRNQCTYVETDRLRTYSDGSEVIDTFVALYRPADGIDCNGNQIPT